jgi:alpha-glucosidase (family GH31 glycosyl hydrolase)
MPAAPIIVGKRRFTMIAPGLVRMEFSPTGQFEDRPSIVAHEPRKALRFAAVEEKPGRVVLDTGRMKIISREHNKAFAAPTLQVQWLREGIFQHWAPGDRDYQNLGGTVHSLDLLGPDDPLEGVHVAGMDPPGDYAKRTYLPHDRGTHFPFLPEYELDPRDAAARARHWSWGTPQATAQYTRGTFSARQENLYHDIARYAPGVLSRSGYCFLNDSTTAVMDEDDFPIARNTPGTQDWYFFLYNDDYLEGLRLFHLLTGKTPLPTKNAFGIFFSRYPAYDEKEARQIIARFQQEGIPLSTLVIDMEWHKEGWCNWDWNREWYPDPKGFFDWARGEGLEVTLNVHPEWIDASDSHYNAFVKRVGRDTFGPRMEPKKKGGQPPPWIGSNHEMVWMNLCDKREASAFLEEVQQPVLDMGVSYWWLDGHAGWIEGTDPTIIANKLYFEQTVTDEYRGMCLTRTGGWGSHRYGVFFTGDTFSRWETLEMEVEFTIRAGHIGVSYVSHDIGGFIHEPTPLIDPRLYIRWLQYGVFSPVIRFHSAPHAGSRQPWDYGEENLKIAKRWLAVRNSLIPYIYTKSRKQYDTGVPLVRGLYLEDGTNEAAYRFDEYLFGDSVLVAPIVTPTCIREIYLPDGLWFAFESNHTREGGEAFNAHVPLAEISAWVRAGSILVRQGPTTKPAQAHVQHLLLDVYPGANGEAELYEDDGRSPAYKTAQGIARTRFRLKDRRGELHLEASPTEGKPQGKTRRVTVQVWLDGPPSSVECDGTVVKQGGKGWMYDAASGRLVVELGKRAVGKGFAVRVVR